MENTATSLCKETYQRKLAQNLPLLRTKLSLSQADLADLIGTSRQTISLIERGSREMMWDTCLSLTFLFMTNAETRTLLSPLGIDVTQITNYLNVSAPKIIPNAERKDGEQK